MKRRVQWRAQVTINAPRQRVWAVGEDIALIPSYHPDVGRVELMSATNRRAPGVEYRCFVTDGPRKGSCVERVTEQIPYEKTVTLSVEDTWGLSALLRDFVTETLLSSQDDRTTTVTMLGYYEPVDLKARIMNLLVLRRMMTRRGRNVLAGIKDAVERADL